MISQIRVKLLATIDEPSNHVSCMLILFNVSGGVSELASVCFADGQTDVIAKMRGELSSGNAFLFKIFGLLVHEALNHSIAVGLSVHYAHAVELHALLVFFVLFVKLDCGGAA